MRVSKRVNKDNVLEGSEHLAIVCVYVRQKEYLIYEMNTVALVYLRGKYDDLE